MESAIANCFSAGDTVVVCRNGKFGDRMKQISEVYGLNVIDLAYEWTQVVDPTDVATALEENPGRARRHRHAVGDVEWGAERRRGHWRDRRRDTPRPLLIVDSITGIGAVECKTDEWELDVVMTGSQKGLMLPPGLAAVSVSAKAWKAYERSTLPKYYFDWMKYKKNIEKETTPFTPAVSLVMGLNVSIGMLREEGLANTIARHSKLAEATRKGCEALGLKLVRAARRSRQRGHAGVGTGGHRWQGDRQDHEEQVRSDDRGWPG